MDDQDEQTQQEPPESPVVTCESCTHAVDKNSTQIVRRTYVGREFEERWCNLCVSTTKTASDRMNAAEDEPEY